MRLQKLMRSFYHFMAPLARLVCCLFFDRKFICGRHFESGLIGYIWAIRSIWSKNILRLAHPLPWPSALTCYVSNPENIHFHPDDLNNFQSPGTYFQNYAGKISIGRGSYIAPNVGLITANHDLNDLDLTGEAKDILIGEKCWIGMGAVLLPGVELGPRTVVAAGAVVTHSFPQGHVVVGGVPAKIMKNLTS